MRFLHFPSVRTAAIYCCFPLLLAATVTSTSATALTLPLSAPQSPVPELERISDWGCDACAGPELFGAVQDVAVTDDGVVFMLDSFAPMVRRFSAGGDAVGFGEKGQGPGEIMSAVAVGVVDSAGIEVIDGRQRRMMRLDFEGNELSTRPMPSYPTVVAYSRPNHAWYFNLIDFTTFTSKVVRMPDGEQQPLPIRDADWPLDDEGEPTEFYPMAVRADGGFAVGDGNGEYRIRLFDADGVAMADIHRDIERTEKSEEEMLVEQQRRDANAERRATAMAAEGGAAVASRPQPPIDPSKRYFYANALRYDAGGRLWVLTGRGDVDTSVFDIFGADNAYLGELSVAAHVTRFDIAGDWLVTSGMGELDHPVVTLWRIR